MRKTLIGFVGITMLTLGFAACASNDQPDPITTDEPADVTITYGFVDSSVPPEYHRSFTLTVANGTGELVVSAYGDELDRVSAEVPDEAVQSVLDAYNGGELTEAFDWNNSNDGCAGGRTYGLRIDDGSQVRETSVYLCAGDSAEVGQTLRDAADPILEPFDVDALTEGRY